LVSLALAGASSGSDSVQRRPPSQELSSEPNALDRPKADQLAAIASGLASLTQGGARCMDGGLVKQTVVEMDRGLLVVMAISEGPA
jgi:hypothetical protein